MAGLLSGFLPPERPDEIDPNYGLSNQQMYDARMGTLTQAGLMLLAAGQRLSPEQRTQMLAQLANLPQQYQQQLTQQMQGKLLASKVAEAESDRKEREAFNAMLTGGGSAGGLPANLSEEDRAAILNVPPSMRPELLKQIIANRLTRTPGKNTVQVVGGEVWTLDENGNPIKKEKKPVDPLAQERMDAAEARAEAAALRSGNFLQDASGAYFRVTIGPDGQMVTTPVPTPVPVAPTPGAAPAAPGAAPAAPGAAPGAAPAAPGAAPAAPGAPPAAPGAAPAPGQLRGKTSDQALTGEERTAGFRFGLADMALADIDRILEKDPSASEAPYWSAKAGQLLPSSIGTDISQSMLTGPQQEYRRALGTLSEAVLRTLSGAGLNLTEIEQMRQRFEPQPTDKPEILRAKEKDLRNYVALLKGLAGRGASLVPDFRATGQPAAPGAAPGPGAPAAPAQPEDLFGKYKLTPRPGG